MSHQCRYCEKTFARESTLAVHLCEPKRRHQERDERGPQLGLQAYLKFYEITQGSSRLKTWDDFVKSPYYRAFVKFGRYCYNTNVIAFPRFLEWLLQNNRKIDHWDRDTVYGEFLLQYLRVESAQDAVERARRLAQDWHEETDHPPRDFMRYGNSNRLCHAITTGRLSPWVVYHSDSGKDFLGNLNPEQLVMIWDYIDADYWQRRFQDYAADAVWVEEISRQEGW